LTGWWPFLKLASSGIIIICAEWTAFEVSSLAASYLATTDLAAQSILLTLSSATYTVPMGISVAATNRVGNCLSGSFVQKSRIASYNALLFAILFDVFNSCFFLLSRTRLGYLFSSDKEVIDLVAHVLPICAVFLLQVFFLSNICWFTEVKRAQDRVKMNEDKIYCQERTGDHHFDIV
jgi:MATE family multidrug resistance protein